MKPQIYQQKCKQVTVDLAGLWEGQLPVFVFQPSSSIPERLYPLGLLNCSTFHTHG